MKILCVDDELGIQQALRRLFRMTSYEIATVSSAREGLEILTRDGTISLVISDYQMPQINGVAFLREVRHNWPEIGRILLTGFGGGQEVREAVANGVIQRLIDKPWQDDELLATVAQWLGPPTPESLSHLSVCWPGG